MSDSLKAELRSVVLVDHRDWDTGFPDEYSSIQTVQLFYLQKRKLLSSCYWLSIVQTERVIFSSEVTLKSPQLGCKVNNGWTHYLSSCFVLSPCPLFCIFHPLQITHGLPSAVADICIYRNTTAMLQRVPLWERPIVKQRLTSSWLNSMLLVCNELWLTLCVFSSLLFGNPAAGKALVLCVWQTATCLEEMSHCGKAPRVSLEDQKESNLCTAVLNSHLSLASIQLTTLYYCDHQINFCIFATSCASTTQLNRHRWL